MEERKKGKRKKSLWHMEMNQSYSCTFQNEVGLSFSAWPAGSKCSSLQLFHRLLTFLNCSLRLGIKGRGRVQLGPSMGSRTIVSEKIRFSSRDLTVPKTGRLSPECTWKPLDSRETNVGLSENPAPKPPAFFSFLFLLPFSFSLTFQLALFFCSFHSAI